MIVASAILRSFAKIGIRARPRFLVWLARIPKSTDPDSRPAEHADRDSKQFYFLGSDGQKQWFIRKDEHVDVEAELRRQIKNESGGWTDAEEQQVEGSLYDWWLNGGWWGNDDNSGNFIPTQMEIDEDTTSVVSFSTTADEK